MIPLNITNSNESLPSPFVALVSILYQTMAYYAPPPAYSQYPQAQKYAILDHYPRRPSHQGPSLQPAQFAPGVPLTRDQAQYVKSYNRAVGIYNASPKKNFLPCSQRGCTNVATNFSNLVIELHLHEIAANGTICPHCTNWFESWTAKDRHMCPGPGGYVPEEDPDMPQMAPPVQQMAAVDPLFFHHSMPIQQYAVVAARRAMEIKRSVRSGSYLPCDYQGCQHQLSSETALMEHLFNHFKHAAGGLCSTCKEWCENARARASHKCNHAHSEMDHDSTYDSSGSDNYDSEYDSDY